MNVKTRALAVLLCLSVSQVGTGDLELAMERFTRAESPAAAEQAVDGVLAVGAGFDAVRAALIADGRLPSDPETGRLLIEQTTADGTAHPSLVLVPDTYDPSRPYPVRVYLHGGVARPRGEAADGSWWRNPQRLASADHISVFPYSWNESLWWQPSQMENLESVLWRLKRNYNVDENRVYLFGVSDGGTGAWAFAFRATTPWAAFFPFIAHPAVLSNPASGVGGELYPINLSAKPVYAVNGDQDRLYPTSAVQPYMTLFRDAGVELTFVSKADAGHTTSWWPQEAPRIEAFVAAHPRDPLPDHIAWRTDSTERSNRAHWVVIEEIGADERPLAEPNSVTVGGRRYLAFPRGLTSGRIDVRRAGNEIDVESWGVLRYTLLLAPTEIDFERPIVVRTDGVESFRGRLEPSTEVLLRWAARDADRTMLFAAELSIEVPESR